MDKMKKYFICFANHCQKHTTFSTENNSCKNRPLWIGILTTKVAVSTIAFFVDKYVDL